MIALITNMLAVLGDRRRGGGLGPPGGPYLTTEAGDILTDDLGNRLTPG